MEQIINAHTHLIDFEGMLRKYGNVALPAGIAVLEDVNAILKMLDPEALIAQMDEAGISQSVLFAVEAPIVYASNEHVSKLCNRFPDRLMGFASVDPTSENAPAVLDHAVRELGLKGLKLHPPLQRFFPNSADVFPVYEKAAELNIPVVFHVGTTPFGSMCRLSQANPILIDDVAREFPNLRIMLTHLGTLWHCEAFMVVEKNPNVFIDTSAYVHEIPQILTPDMITRIGANKVVFGTDFPMPYANRPHRMKDFVDAIYALKLSKEVERGFFQDNFFRLLHGESRAEQSAITIQDVIDRVARRSTTDAI